MRVVSLFSYYYLAYTSLWVVILWVYFLLYDGNGTSFLFSLCKTPRVNLIRNGLFANGQCSELKMIDHWSGAFCHHTWACFERHSRHSHIRPLCQTYFRKAEKGVSHELTDLHLFTLLFGYKVLQILWRRKGWGDSYKHTKCVASTSPVWHPSTLFHSNDHYPSFGLHYLFNVESFPAILCSLVSPAPLLSHSNIIHRLIFLMYSLVCKSLDGSACCTE